MLVKCGVLRISRVFSEVCREMGRNSCTTECFIEKGRRFVWEEPMERAFLELKRKLTKPPILAFPNWNLPFILSTDASNTALGALLEQKDEEGVIHRFHITQGYFNQPKRDTIPMNVSYWQSLHPSSSSGFIYNKCPLLSS